jgi:hypothetical protein
VGGLRTRPPQRCGFAKQPSKAMSGSPGPGCGGLGIVSAPNWHSIFRFRRRAPIAEKMRRFSVCDLRGDRLAGQRHRLGPRNTLYSPKTFTGALADP